MGDQDLYPPFRPEQEVRLAVVMYGGVSLAIYIHGVAQELLSLVRATAPETPFRAAKDSPEVGGEGRVALLSEDGAAPRERRLRGAERVYRKLGQMLPGAAATAGGSAGKPNAGDPIRTRVVVDILSGTSAGGINGIFLAKALAANRPMDGLKDLWVQQGDLARLINDRRSYTDDVEDLEPQEPPASLLNSRRMYAKLLLALARMDAGSSSKETPFVDELDLFVTATDIEGLPLLLPAGDIMASERRHKNVFHFRYARGDDGAPADDFGPDIKPFLAFAARCTSSFPFAFEPMALGDIDEVLDLPVFHKPRLKKVGFHRSDHSGWRRFYEDYLRADGGPEKPFQKVAFGDGGYLDNKPFTHALGTLRRRRSDFPVDRKLVYVEPAPEHPERDPRRDGKPDALENVLAALVLPHYETIREDLDAVRELNRLVDRVQVVLGGRDTDSPHWGRKRVRSKVSKMGVGKDWREEDLSDMLGRYGLAYGAYHRLKVAVVTDQLADLVATVSGFHPQSDERLAIRYLVGAWRSRTYTLYHPPEQASEQARLTENSFLFELDLWWRLRRLSFLRSRTDELVGLDLEEAERRIRSLPELDGDDRLAGKLRAPGGLDELRRALLMIKWGLSYAQADLSQTPRRLAEALPSSPRTGQGSETFAAAVRAMPIELSGLVEITAQPSDERRRELAKNLVDGELRQAFDHLAEVLRGEMEQVMRKAAHGCQTILGARKASDAQDPVAEVAAHLARKCPDCGPIAQTLLGHYYRYFEEYDMISFPILYETGLGEVDPVEVVRISPEDATHLFDGAKRRTSQAERAEGADNRVQAGRGRPKLAGTLLANFGAFLAERWRINDMLWGRLDAAERLITALLPEDRRSREELIEEAQVEILAEELHRGLDREAAGLLAEAVARAAASRDRDDLARALRGFAGEVRGAQLEKLLAGCLEHDRLGAFFIESSQAGRELPPQDTLRSAARATEVVGKMLESLAAARPAVAGSQRWLRLVTWLGRLLWGLVELAVPRSLGNLLARHWLHLLYAFEALAVIGGTLLGQEGVAAFGWTALGITFGLHLLLHLLNALMRGRRGLLRKLGVAVVVLVLALAGLGGIYVKRHLIADFRLWWSAVQSTVSAADAGKPQTTRGDGDGG